ncbi:MAG: hypothetical protein Q4D22_02985 [Candidatus Saccharibacteria bacterium]|nr:hypothetical protein [Candidatus Saccharibacteria bacterium]
MENEGWYNPFADNWGHKDSFEANFSTDDVIGEAESDEIYQQNMAQKGRAARTIAGKLRYKPIITESYLPRAEYHSTSFEDYLGRDYSGDILSDEKIANSVKSTYKDIITEHPALKAVQITSLKSDESAGFSYWATTAESGDDARPHMEIRGDFTEGSHDDEFSESEYLASKIIADRLAIELGCDATEIMASPVLQRDLLLLHEFGHAESLINRYIKPCYKNIKNGLGGISILNSEKEQFSLAISDAAAEWARRTDVTEDAKMLAPGSIGSYEERTGGMCEHKAESYRSNIIRRLQLRFEASEAKDVDDVKVEDARRYRLQDEEKIADNFARDYVMNHFDKYFLAPGVKADGSGRLETGSEVDISEVFDIDLDCKAGSYIMLKSRADGVVRDGRLLYTPHVGKELLLTGSDDPDETDDVINYGVVESVRCKTITDKNGNRHRQISMRTDSGDYLMSMPKEMHRAISRSPEELREAVNAGKGQELQLMGLLMSGLEEDYEDDSGEYDDAVGRGGIVYGKVLEDVEIGAPIVLGVQAGNSRNLKEWKSWPVSSIEQDWRTWRINTQLGKKTASYEVLPLPKMHQKIKYPRS